MVEHMHRFQLLEHGERTYAKFYPALGILWGLQFIEGSFGRMTPTRIVPSFTACSEHIRGFVWIGAVGLNSSTLTYRSSLKVQGSWLQPDPILFWDKFQTGLSWYGRLIEWRKLCQRWGRILQEEALKCKPEEERIFWLTILQEIPWWELGRFRQVSLVSFFPLLWLQGTRIPSSWQRS